MDFRRVKWSKKHYSLKKMLKECKLPLIIRVVHGCSTENSNMEISKDEVFRLQSTIQERRVVAYTNHREYSMPIHYGKKVKVIPKKGVSDSAPTYLTDLFEDGKKVKLPLTVEFVRMPPVLDDPGVKPIIEGPFSLKEVVKKDYLLCSRVSSESIETDVVILPVDTDTEIRIAEGLLNGNKSEWANIMQDINSITEKVNFNMYRGIKDVIIKPLYKKPRHYSERSRPLRVQERTHPGRRLSAPEHASTLPSYSQTQHQREIHSSHLSNLNYGDMSQTNQRQRSPSQPVVSPRDYRGIDRNQVQLRHHTDIHGNHPVGLNVPQAQPRYGISQEISEGPYGPPPPYSPSSPTGQYPGQRLDRNSNEQQTVPKQTVPKPNKWSSLPDRLEDFTVADVCKSLQLLDIHTYYTIFKEENIDGVKLKTYDLDRMTKELKMRPRDALTLDKLIERGKPSD
ncbi:uncharacterized protein [Antedon mediterranea]|uniref:uncharacterized protein n=1 Tax=Antedon mediterranea TaxID=105859 RepID=UPI003AF91A11